jgi:hypothetical protein
LRVCYVQSPPSGLPPAIKAKDDTAHTKEEKETKRTQEYTSSLARLFCFFLS